MSATAFTTKSFTEGTISTSSATPRRSSSTAVTSASIDTSKDGISERDCTMRRAIVAPVAESGMIVVGPFGADAAGAPFVAPARSTSSLRIRPPDRSDEAVERDVDGLLSCAQRASHVAGPATAIQPGGCGGR